MSEWHRNHPEEAEAIASLPPSERLGAERAAIGDPLEHADLERKRRREIDATFTPWHKDVYELARLLRWLALFDELPRDIPLYLETALSWSDAYDRMQEALGK